MAKILAAASGIISIGFISRLPPVWVGGGLGGLIKSISVQELLWGERLGAGGARGGKTVGYRCQAGQQWAKNWGSIFYRFRRSSLKPTRVELVMRSAALIDAFPNALRCGKQPQH